MVYGTFGGWVTQVMGVHLRHSEYLKPAGTALGTFGISGEHMGPNFQHIFCNLQFVSNCAPVTTHSRNTSSNYPFLTGSSKFVGKYPFVSQLFSSICK